MSSKAHTERLARAISGTGLAEAVAASFGDNRVAVLCRVKDTNMKKWLEVVTNVLLGAQSEAQEIHRWQCHICQHYFLKEVNGQDKLVWGWNFSIQSSEMTLSLDVVIRVLKGLPPREFPQNEVMEMPMLGAPPDRNAPKGGKGVHDTKGGRDFHPLRSNND